MELMQMLGMKPTKADVEKMISEIDEDGNGEVDFSEFLQVMAGPQNLPYSKKELMTSFKTIANSSNPAGTIHPKDLETALVGSLVHSPCIAWPGWV
jgi:calmodulin